MRIPFYVAAALFMAIQCSAQEARGTLLGRVTDASGAAVPAAAVQVTNAATGVAVNTETNEQGNYLVPLLQPGTYRIAAQRPGFKNFRRDNIEIRVGDRLEINVNMEVGEVTETVTVSAETPLLETASASMGQVVDARRIAELPLPHGVPYQLIQLAPGVGYAGNLTQDGPYASYHASYTMDGARANRSEMTIDGVPTGTTNYTAGALLNSFVPPADSVAEFKVQTATFDASAGNTEGGTVNMSMKSGTNDLHGTLLYAKMAPEQTANTFFGNRNQQARADFDYNRWGGTAGGPLWLGRLYNGRNRTFFYYAYEAIHETKVRGTTLTVPTAKERAGDFSDLLAAGARYQIYDPATRRAAAGGRFQSDPMPGNVIAPSRISPVARNILGYYPLPIAAGTVDGFNNYPIPNAGEPLTYYVHSGRIDHSLSDRHRFFVRGNVYKRDSVYAKWFDNMTQGQYFQFLNRGGVFDDVYALSPRMVMNFRYGYNRFVRYYDASPESRGLDLTGLGFAKSYNDMIPTALRRFPRINIEGFAPTYNGVLWRPDEVHDFALSFTQTSGEHSLKYGAQYRVYRENQYNADNVSTGNLDFSSTWTRGPMDNSPAAPIGQGLASFLLGLPSGGYADRRSSYAQQSTAWAFYFHDDWKLTRKLTVNLGIRYEIEGPLTERFDRTVRGFDPQAQLPIAAQAAANYAKAPTPEVPASQFRVQGGLLFAGVNGQPRTLWARDNNNFMPRLGLAYSLGPKTVLRAGFGMFFGFLGTRRTDVNQIGFTERTNLDASLDGGLTFLGTLANPFPNGITEPRGAALGAMTYAGQGISFFNGSPLAPRMQRWQLGVQREISKSVVAEASYVGNRGGDIETARNLNAFPLRYLSTLPTRDQAAIDYWSANLANPFYPMLPGTGRSSTVLGRSVLVTPHPQFGAVSTTTNEGSSEYHSLQLRVEKRFSKGLTVQGSYTWSKFMEGVEFLNQPDPEPAWTVSAEDFTHRLSISGIFELPFGKGRRWLSAAGTLTPLVSGWQVQGIYAGQSGPPFGFGNVPFVGSLKDIPLPNSQRTVERWFNTDAGFERDTRRQLSWNLRTAPLRYSGIRADGINNWDLSIIKDTHISDRMRIQLRGEFLNAMNHPMFAAPNANPFSTAFGSITAERALPRRVQLGVKFIY